MYDFPQITAPKTDVEAFRALLLDNIEQALPIDGSEHLKEAYDCGVLDDKAFEACLYYEITSTVRQPIALFFSLLEGLDNSAESGVISAERVSSIRDALASELLEMLKSRLHEKHMRLITVHSRPEHIKLIEKLVADEMYDLTHGPTANKLPC